MNLKQVIENMTSRSNRKRDFLSAPELTSGDIFLVSFPRSGNTWVRVIIGNILSDGREIPSLVELNTLVPDIHIALPKKGFLLPRVIKTHRPYAFRHERDRPELYKKIIYIIRNPFDVIKSYYSYLVNIKPNTESNYEKFVHDLIHGMIAPGSWNEHVLSWHAASRYNETLFVKYEDLQNKTQESIERIALFLGKQLRSEEISLIKGRSNLDTMRRMEKTGSPVSKKYEFVRSGLERNIEGALSMDMIQLVRDRSKSAMEIFGYL